MVDFAAVAAGFAADLEPRAGRSRPAAPSPASPSPVPHAGQHARGDDPAPRAVAVCAGAWSDRLAVAAGAPAEPRIVPFRGAYLRLRPERATWSGRTSTRCPIPTCRFWAPI